MSAAFALFVSATMLGCYQNVPRSAVDLNVRTIKDDLGRSVSLPEKVDSVVSLAPNLTEIVFAVGGGDTLVGVTSFCNYPEKASYIAKVSDTQKPNIERLIALKPQVVFVSTASQLEAFTKTLEEQKIAVFVTDAKDLDDIYKSIVAIGTILNKKEKAEDLVFELKKRVNRVNANSADPRPKTFVQIDRDSLYTIGRDSYITDIISKAGAVSATADLASAYPKLSRESAVAMEPDLIVISESDGNREPSDAFRLSPAVRNNNVVKINSDLLSRPGPRTVDALEQIAEKISQMAEKRLSTGGGR